MTPHNEAKKEDIAKIVIMSGDPMRAKFIAEEYLTNYRLVNDVRGMFAYTGEYKGKTITVMGHGMGMASAGIYFYELFKFYDVEIIIRIGTCGTANPNIKLLDLVLVEDAYTESNYAKIFSKKEIYLESAHKGTLNKLKAVAEEKNISFLNGTIMTCDVFDSYVDWKVMIDRVPSNINILGTEMEAFALFHIANCLNKKAACVVTVVDSKYIKDVVSSEDREKSLHNMIEITLDSILL